MSDSSNNNNDNSNIPSGDNVVPPSSSRGANNNDNNSNNTVVTPQPSLRQRRVVRVRVPAGARVHLQQPGQSIPTVSMQPQQQQQQSSAMAHSFMLSEARLELHQEQQQMRNLLTRQSQQSNASNNSGTVSSPNEQATPLWQAINEGERELEQLQERFAALEHPSATAAVQELEQIAANMQNIRAIALAQTLSTDTSALIMRQLQVSRQRMRRITQQVRIMQPLPSPTDTTDNNTNNNNSNNNNAQTQAAVAQLVQMGYAVTLRRDGGIAAAATATVPPLQVRPLPDTQQELRNDQDDDNNDSDDEEAPPTCSICWEYLSNDIRQCQHEICTARFCGSCVQKYLATQRHSPATVGATFACPMCQQNITQFKVDQELQESWRTIERKCRFANCTTVLPLPELTAHEATCPRQRVTCRYVGLGCKWQGIRANVQAHEAHDCKFHPMAPWIQQQRQNTVHMQRQLAALTAAVAERQQRAAFLEHRLGHVEERLRQVEMRLANVGQMTAQRHEQVQQQQQQQQQTRPPGLLRAQFQHARDRVRQRLREGLFSTYRQSAQIAHVQPHLTFGPMSVAEMIQTWVTALRRPALLLAVPRTTRAARTWSSIPTRLVAMGTVLDILFATGSSVWQDPTLIPWFTMVLLSVAACRGWTADGPAMGMTWCIVLHWFRHSDQCLTIWLSATVATVIGCDLLGGGNLHLSAKMPWDMAMAWVWVANGLARSIPVIAVIAFANLVWGQSVERSLSIFVGLITLVYYAWSLRGVVLMWGLFFLLTRLVCFFSARLARVVRACPTKVTVWATSCTVLLFLSWSVADCLYIPMESWLDWMLFPVDSEGEAADFVVFASTTSTDLASS